MASVGDELEDAIIGLIFMAILVLVALWYFSQPGGALAVWLDQQGANLAGGVSMGMYNTPTIPGFVSGPVNNFLANATAWLDSWTLGTPNVAGVTQTPGLLPVPLGGGLNDTDVENAQ